MSTSTLRQNDTIIFNPTGRIDIEPRNVLFEVSEVDGQMRYRVTLKNWDVLAKNITSGFDLSVSFTRSGMADRRDDLGKAKANIRGAGIIQGKIEGGFNLSAVGATILITDPSDNHKTVVKARKGKPDVIDADIPDSPEDVSQPVRPFRPASGKEDGMLNIYEDASVSGQWDVLLENVEVPQLVVSPRLGKDRVVSDVLVQNLILPEVFRRIMNAMVKEKERYEHSAWYPSWKDFALQITGAESWNDFEAPLEDPTLGDVDDMIREAVSKYTERLLPALERLAQNYEIGSEE